MSNLLIESNPNVENVFDKYPSTVRSKLEFLRKIVVEVANETESIATLEETLKWGEPSYLAKHGSTLRMDYKSKTPDQYAMYFKCTSKLVETFKEVFNDTFTYEGNRAIVFQLNDDIPEKELKLCIKATLTYHKVKHLPQLGIL